MTLTGECSRSSSASDRGAGRDRPVRLQVSALIQRTRRRRSQRCGCRIGTDPSSGKGDAGIPPRIERGQVRSSSGRRIDLHLPSSTLTWVRAQSFVGTTPSSIWLTYRARTFIGSRRRSWVSRLSRPGFNSCIDFLTQGAGATGNAERRRPWSRYVISRRIGAALVFIWPTIGVVTRAVKFVHVLRHVVVWTEVFTVCGVEKAGTGYRDDGLYYNTVSVSEVKIRIQAVSH